MSGEHRAQGSSSEQGRAKQAAGCQRSTDVHLFTGTGLWSTREHAKVRMIEGEAEAGRSAQAAGLRAVTELFLSPATTTGLNHNKRADRKPF